MTVPRGLLQWSALMRQTRLPRGHEHRGGGYGADYQEGSQELEPSAIDNDRGDEAGTESDPARATERELDRREQQDEQSRADRTCRGRSGTSGEAESHQGADRGEKLQAVPVPDRL